MYETCNRTVPDCAPEYPYKKWACALDLPLQLGTSDCQLQQSPWLSVDSGPAHVENRSRQVLISPALRQLEDHVPSLSLCDCQCPGVCIERETDRERERSRTRVYEERAHTHTDTHTNPPPHHLMHRRCSINKQQSPGCNTRLPCALLLHHHLPAQVHFPTYLALPSLPRGPSCHIRWSLPSSAPPP